MKKIKNNTIFTSVFFINVMPIMANGMAHGEETEMPMETPWMLLLAGIILGFYRIYKYEKIKRGPIIIAHKF